MTNQTFDVNAIRADFPILQQKINNAPLVYLDNGASTQKPSPVIEKLVHFYTHDYSNVHRGIHTLSQRATDQYEEARRVVQRFINAKSDSEIIFTSGSTDALNLVAHSWVKSHCQAGDEIIISTLEHHSNIVPWQMLAHEYQLKLKIIPVNDAGEILFDEYLALLSDKTKLVAINHISNSLGTINPIEDIIPAAKKVGAKVVIDGAQAVAHLNVDVQALDCDFYAFTSHKLYGPTGLGVLYGKAELLNAMPPFKGGGEMIKTVSFEHTEYNDIPHKFEAGTPNIAGAIGLAAAIEYVQNLGLDNIAQHEQQLTEYATEKLLSINGLRMIGTAKHKSGILSFLVDGAHASDLGTLLDSQGIAVRVGHHCTMPLMERLGVNATTRASLAMYNTENEIDRFYEALKRAIALLQ